MKKVIKKKLTEEVSVSNEAPVLSETTGTPLPTIGLLELDLGRGDLNLLRDKLNEVINKINVN